MRLDPSDLRCPSCGAAIHPFVASCPACGAACESLLSEARRDPDIGAATLAGSDELVGDVRMVANFYRLRSGGAPDGITLAQGIGIALDVVQYRLEGAGAPVDQAWLSLDGDVLLARDRRTPGERTAVRLELPVWSILAATAGDGRLTVHRPGGDPIVIRNRSGLLANRPRPDHYRALERWLAVLIAETAERRWKAVGIESHLAELGLGAHVPATVAGAAVAGAAVAGAAAAGAAGPGPSPDPAGAPAPTPTAPIATGAPIADALRSLDGLRAAALVSDDEYRTKRQEILDRL